jgi:phosphoglycolate phosphatase
MAVDVRRVRAVVFDLDGTLTDSADSICSTVARTMAEAGREPPPAHEVRATIGLPLRGIMQRYAPDADDDQVERLLARYRQIYDDEVIPATRMFRGGLATLRDARRAGMRVGLATTKHTRIAHAVLRQCRIGGYFHYAAGGDAVDRPKPNPDLLLHVLDRLEIDASETLLVGDGDHDIHMGRRAGAMTCGVSWGVHDISRLEDAGADLLVHSFAELRRHLFG